MSFRPCRRFSAAAAAGLPAVLWCCGPPPPPAPAPGTEPAADEIYRDVTAAAGLDFVHTHGGFGELYFNEIAGAGGAFLDYDGDGDLDVFLVQGAALDPHAADSGPPLLDRLYRNDGVDPATGVPGFTDVTESSGLRSDGYGMGVAVADVDNDGRLDVYVTNWGANRLWHNQGRGGDGTVTFRDVTAASGAGDDRWSTSAAFFDYDRDGWLDLYVVNYVDFRTGNHVPCRGVSSRRDYCGPQNYEPQPDRLLRNLGAGGELVFEDVSGTAGILAEARRGLGVVTLDADGDGWLDLYVANDRQVNFLWRNREGRGFDNEAVLRGCAVNADGVPEASMGVDAGDLDGDGDEDLFVSHLRTETNTAYVNDGGFFDDRSGALRLTAASLPHTGFGTALLDFDNDGLLDVVVVNGDVRGIEELVRASDPFPFGQPDQLFRNLGGGAFGEVPAARAGSAFARAEVGRGLAVGDVDDDGDPDLLITNANGPARLLLDTVGQDRPWVGLRLVGGAARRDLLGARATVEYSGGGSASARVRTDASYCSARDPRLRFAVPAGETVRRVRVQWPDGSEETFGEVAPGRYSVLRQGEGR